MIPEKQYQHADIFKEDSVFMKESISPRFPKCAKCWRTSTIVLLFIGTTLPSRANHGQLYGELGLTYRTDMKISVRGGSSAFANGVNAAVAGTVENYPVARATLLDDDGTVQVLREFDDGYVGPSGWAWAREAGVTQYFSYEEDGQYDAGNDTLSYLLTLSETSAPGEKTVTGISSGTPGWNDGRRNDELGLMVTVGYRFPKKQGDWTWGAQMRIGWLGNMDARFRDRPAFSQVVERTVFQATLRQDQTYAFTYDTLGNPLFPAAPYTMTDPAGVGPLISALPDSIELQSESSSLTENMLGHTTETAVSLADLDVDAHAVTVQFGPRLQWQSEEKATAFFVQGAFTVNRLKATMQRLESFNAASGASVAVWNDRNTDKSWKMGAGAQFGAKLEMNENWYLILAGGYEWVDHMSASIGPDRVTIDISGYQGEIAIGRRF